jgi:hypothetical protein
MPTWIRLSVVAIFRRQRAGGRTKGVSHLLRRPWHGNRRRPSFDRRGFARRRPPVPSRDLREPGSVRMTVQLDVACREGTRPVVGTRVRRSLCRTKA